MAIRKYQKNQRKGDIERMSTYQEKKKKAREKAIEWQERFGEQSISYEELAIAQSVFEQLGRRYGLLTEFRENGIC